MSNAFIQALLMDDPDAGVSPPTDPDFPFGCTGNPYWASVVLALNFNAADGSTTVTDSSTFADHKTVTAGGQIISSTSPKHGSGSLKLLKANPIGILWRGTRFNRAASSGWTIDFWYTGNTAGFSNAPVLVHFLDSTLANMFRLSQGFPSATMDFQVGASAAVSLTRTTDVDGRTYIVIKWGADDYLRIYFNAVLAYSVFVPGGMIGSPYLYVAGGVSETPNAHTAYMDTFRVTQADIYPSGVTVPTGEPCNGIIDISAVSVPGTEALTGIGMTATAGDLNSPAGFRRLSGQAITTGTGSVSVFNANRTVALVGQSLTTARGSLAYLSYPNLLSATIDLNPIPTWGALVITFLTDGTYLIEQVTYYYFGKVTYTGRWLEDSEINETLIAHQYRCAALTNYGDGPPVLNTSVVDAIGQVEVAFVVPPTYVQYVDFSISIVPKAGNPRYGEVGYSGYFRIKIPMYYTLPP